MAVDIKIMYKLKNNNDNWLILKLTPEQYFDPLDPWEEEYEVGCVPRLIFDIRDYLKEENNNITDEAITNVNVFLKDIEKNAEISFYYIYWNNGKNMFVERKDKMPLKSYHEIIIDLRIAQDTCEILRFREKNGTMYLIMHVRIVDNPDGSQSEFNYLIT